MKKEIEGLNSFCCGDEFLQLEGSVVGDKERLFFFFFWDERGGKFTFDKFCLITFAK